MKQQFSSKTLVTLLCGAAIAFNAVAQNSQSTVIVSGSRFEENLNEVPANVKVITRDEIANSTSNNIPDVLSQIGGLVVRSTNPGQLNLDATVDMGGFGASANSTTLVLIDGQRLNPIDSLGVAWESIPLDSIERIEITQGGASVQYGNGAVGGVINIITNGGKSNLNQATVNYGSFNTLINNAILRNTVDKTTIQLTANTSNTNGWRQNSAANAYSFDGKITQNLGGIDVAYMDLYVSHTNAQNPGGTIGQVGGGNPQAAKFNNIGSATQGDNSGVRAGGTKALNETYTLVVDASYGNRSVAYSAPYYASADATANGYVANATNTSAQSWDLTFSPRIKADLKESGTTVIGYDFNKASQNSNNAYGANSQQIILANQGPFDFNTFTGGYFNNALSNNQTANLINQSVYAISRLPITPTLEATGGFRRQVQMATAYNSEISLSNPINASQTYGANAGDVALNYNYLKGQKIYAKWNQSFRFANIDEFWGYNPITFERVFSGILKPQITQTYEMGGEWHLSKARITSSLFQSVTQNEIRLDLATSTNINDPNNIGRKGILLDSSINAWSNLNLAAGGRYQKSSYVNGPYSGNGIALVPDLTLNARASYLINTQWTVGGVVNYIGSQYYDADPGISNSLAKMPAYTTADLFAGYREGKWETRFTIKNVGSVNYASYGGYNNVSTPGQNFTSKPVYYYYPSDPRAVFLSIKYTL